MSKDNKQSLITDINEAKADRGEDVGNQEAKEVGEDPIFEAMESTDFSLSDDQPIEEQVQNLHGQLLVRVVKKIKMTGSKIGQEDISMIAQTIIKVMEQKMLFSLLERIGVEDISDVITNDDQEEIIDIFGIRSSLDVSEEDMKKLQQLDPK